MSHPTQRNKMNKLLIIPLLIILLAVLVPFFTPDPVHPINLIRAEYNLPPLLEVYMLTKSAQKRARELENEPLSHNGFSETITTYYGVSTFRGENLARHTQDVWTAWMNSSTHRDVILSPQACEFGVSLDGQVKVLHVGCKQWIVRHVEKRSLRREKVAQERIALVHVQLLERSKTSHDIYRNSILYICSKNAWRQSRSIHLRWYNRYMLILLTAIIFFYIGKYAQSSGEKEVIQKFLTQKKAIKPGVIPFKSSQELEYDRTLEKKVEEEWKKLPLVNG